MKCRVEPQGLHFYDRVKGLHVLLDEFSPDKSECSVSPRTVSIAITDECDFRCSYCYVNLRDRYMSTDRVIDYCSQLDKLGTFDVALGGGEPTLHPDLPLICNTIWKETGLGLSITTHGHNITGDLLSSLLGNVSIIRISIDGLEPVYSQLRKRPLSELLPKLKLLSGVIPFGINMVVNKLTIHQLDNIKKLCYEYGASELLLLPMWHKGKFVLNPSEWEILNQWINANYLNIQLRISSEAREFISSPYLFTSDAWYKDYGFIGIDDTFRVNSFTRTGISINEFDSLEEVFRNS